MSCWARARFLGLTGLARGGGGKPMEGDRRRFCSSTTISECRRFCSSSTTISECQGPMMMSPTWEYRDYDRPASFPSEEEEKDFYFFYGLSEPISHFVKEKVLPPNCLSKEEARCVGSSHGWLAFLNTNNSSLSIVNPFIPPSIKTAIPSSIPLPPLPLGYSYVKKLILSADPYGFLYTDKRSHTGLQLPCNYEDIVYNCKVIAIIGGPSSFDIAFCQLGESGWTLLRGAPKNCYGEIMYSAKDQCLYAMGGHREFHQDDYDYSFEAWDLLSHEKQVIQPFFAPKIISRVPLPNTFFPDNYYNEPLIEKRYLVEFMGDIFLVLRIVTDNPFSVMYPDHQIDPPPDGNDGSYQTTLCYVYKLKRDNEHDHNYCKWEAVTEPVPTFFVGLNHSFGVHTFGQLFKSWVYYTDDYFDKMSQLNFGGHDSGAYKIGCKTWDLRYYPPSPMRRMQPPPVLVQNPRNPPRIMSKKKRRRSSQNQ